MELKEYITDELKLEKKGFKIFSFIDFANVTNWFQKDRQTWDNKSLLPKEQLKIDIKGLYNISNSFSKATRIYFGEDPKNERSKKFTDALRIYFNQKNVITKDIQKIKHYFDSKKDLDRKYDSFIQRDHEGRKFVEIRKCNFDVEISVDAIKMLNYYDVFCIFSGDADFVYLNKFLRKKKKKVIVIKSGYITGKLKKSADLVINAQQIKKSITEIKQKPD